MSGAGPDMPAERLFQQRLAQVAPLPTAPTVTTPVTPGGQLMPAPIILNPNAPQNKQPQPGYELTPYTPPEITTPTITPKPVESPGTVQGAGRSSVSGTLQPATAPTPTNIAVLNQGLSQISKTLRLELLSPAAQLTINRVADQNGIGPDSQYALGLQTPGDGNHLALVGSLKDLIGLFSQANNAQFFTPMLNSDASVTLKGLQQRYTQALNTEAGQVALNHTRAELKQLEAASAPGYQSFKQLYPNLSLSTVADRSSAWQNGIGANRQADRLGAGLNQTYVLGYQLPVKLNNNTTIQVPVNLIGPLKDLAQFFLRGGDSWLQASGLTSNKSTGLIPEGVMQRYGVAKANTADSKFDPNQRSENQTGSTVGRQLAKNIDLPTADSEETTVPTILANGAEQSPSPFITVKPSDEDKDKSKGIIAPQLSQNTQPVNPDNTKGSNKNGTGPIKASDAKGNDTPTSGSDDNQEKISLVTIDDINELGLSADSSTQKVRTKVSGLMKEKYLAHGGSTEKINTQLVRTLWADFYEQWQNSDLHNLEARLFDTFSMIYDRVMLNIDYYTEQLKNQVARIEAKIPEWKSAVDRGEDIVVILDIDKTVIMRKVIKPMDIFNIPLYFEKSDALHSSADFTVDPIPEMQDVIRKFEENGIPYWYITVKTRPPDGQPDPNIEKLREFGLFGDHAHPQIDYVTMPKNKAGIRNRITTEEGHKIVGSIGDSSDDLTGNPEIDFEIPRPLEFPFPFY